jgi:hypothetical protein
MGVFGGHPGRRRCEDRSSLPSGGNSSDAAIRPRPDGPACLRERPARRKAADARMRSGDPSHACHGHEEHRSLPSAQTRATKQSGCRVWIAAGAFAPSRRRLRRAPAVARVSGAEPVDGSSTRATKLVAGHHLRSRRAIPRSTRAPKRATVQPTPPGIAIPQAVLAGPPGTRCLLDSGVWRARDLAEQGRRGPVRPCAAALERARDALPETKTAADW